MRAFSAVIIMIGAIVMVQATIRYHRLYLLNREETYKGQNFHGIPGLVSLVLMYFFIVGYAVGFTHVLLVEVEPIYVFVAVIFFLGGAFIYASVEAQIRMHSQLREKSMEIMRAFVNTIDMKDAFTKGHSQQVHNLVELLFDYLDPALQAKINKPKLLDAAILHDIGKVSIQDDVLSKAGPLAPREWDQIKMHPANGKRMLDETVFRDISAWVLYHHERLDGNGYYSLPAESIPVESRIIAIADTYGALCTDRVFRPRKTHEAAIAIMSNAMGSQLDPALMNAFLRIRPEQLEEALRNV